MTASCAAIAPVRTLASAPSICMAAVSSSTIVDAKAASRRDRSTSRRISASLCAHASRASRVSRLAMPGRHGLACSAADSVSRAGLVKGAIRFWPRRTVVGDTRRTAFGHSSAAELPLSGRRGGGLSSGVHAEKSVQRASLAERGETSLTREATLPSLRLLDLGTSGRRCHLRSTLT